MTDDNPRYISWAEPTDVPPDAIRVEAEAVGIALAAADAGQIDFGLYLELPPPLGAIRVTLRPEQIAALHTKLDSLLALDDGQVAELVAQLHAS